MPCSSSWPWAKNRQHPPVLRTGTANHGGVEPLTRAADHGSTVCIDSSGLALRPVPWQAEVVQHLATAEFHEGTSALLATAIHAGSAMRETLVHRCALNAEERLREEDPFTDLWVNISDNRIIGLRSRFEVDLNRPPEKAVYLTPEDAWGLHVWKDGLPEEHLAASRAEHAAFYGAAEGLMTRLLERHPRVVVYDLHSYNHQRGGSGLLDDPALNPEINIGTGNLDRAQWGSVVDALIDDLRIPDEHGHGWDVRENVKFRGGYFGQWLNARFGARVCPLAIELKKTFMDEWTGIPDPAMIQRIQALLQRSIPTVMHAAHALGS